MQPSAAVRPKLLAWVIRFTSPAVLLLGAIVVVKEPGWGALCLAAGAINAFRSGRMIVRWSRAKRAGFKGTEAAGRPHRVDAFLSDEVSWVPARFMEGLRSQPGWAVLRPDWVVFLPSGGAKHAVAAMALAAGGLIRTELGTIAYGFEAVLRQGLAVFDETILRWGAETGRVLARSEADILRSRMGVMFRSSPTTYVHCLTRPPEALVAGWRPGVAAFDAKGLAKLLAALTAVPFTLGAAGGVIAYFAGESLASICLGVGFWWSVVVLAWVGYLVVYLRSR